MSATLYASLVPHHRVTVTSSRVASFFKFCTTRSAEQLSITDNPLNPLTVQTRDQDLSEGVTKMLWTIFVILLVLWLLGVVSSYTMGGFIHILLVLAVIALIF